MQDVTPENLESIVNDPDVIKSQLKSLQDAVAQSEALLQSEPRDDNYRREYSGALTRLREFSEAQVTTALEKAKISIWTGDLKAAEQGVRDARFYQTVSPGVREEVEKIANIVACDRLIETEIGITYPGNLVVYAKFCLAPENASNPQSRYKARRALTRALNVSGPDELWVPDAVRLLQQTIP